MRDRFTRHLLVLRWIARIWSVATLLVILLLIVGEGIHPAPHEVLGLVFYPFGICAGLILAWWKEGLGGSITVGSLAVFYVIHLATAGSLPQGWGWITLAAPGFLFLLASVLSPKASSLVT